MSGAGGKLSPKDNFYVYILYRPWNGTPCYVGKGKNQRWREHEKLGPRHYNKHLWHTIQKAGGSLPCVKVAEGLTNSQAVSIEKVLIKILGRNPGDLLVNLTDGGEGAQGRKMTEAQRKRNGEIHRNKKMSEEDKALRRQHVRDRLAAGFVFRHSEETKQRLSEMKKGWKRPAAANKATGDGLRGRPKTPAHIAAVQAGKLRAKLARESRQENAPDHGSL